MVMFPSGTGSRDKVAARELAASVPLRHRRNRIDAQDAARNNTAFQPGKVTHCNAATCSIVQAMNAPMDPFVDKKGNIQNANFGAKGLAASDKYREVTPEEAQALANKGVLVIGAYEAKSGSGHLDAVRPEGVSGDSPRSGGKGPLLNDVGRNVGVMNQNYAFGKGKEIHYYTPK